MATGHEAVVYDLDGTLVDLPVDWDDARRDAAAVLRARGVDVEGLSLWEVLETAVERGYRRPVSDAIAEYERDAARRATRLRVADELPRDGPAGVCSLNAEAACRIALELHGIDPHLGAVVGRDTVETHKPDPEPLLHAIERLGANPGQSLFVGDSDRDQVTARRAGVDYRWARDR
jgi:phosphoglycolate phosphatase